MNRATWRSSWTVATFTAVLLVVVGCNSSSPEKSKSGDGHSLAEALLGQTDEAAAHDFVENRTMECVRAAGLEYFEVPFDAVQVNGIGLAATLEERQLRGFGIVSADTADPVVDDPNTEYLDTLDKPTQEEWLGNVQRCADKSRAERDRRLADFNGALTDEDAAALKRIVTDPAGTEAINGWRGCMSDRGWSYSTRSDMENSLQTEFESLQDGAAIEGFQQTEIAVAVDDFECAAAHLEPFIQDAVDQIAAQIGDKYGVTSLYTDEWELQAIE